MKYLSFLLALVFITSTADARIWRINNNIGINADFTTFHEAVNSSSVVAGDTLYFEPSTTDYQTNSISVSKRLVMIGPGYFLDPSNTFSPGNPNLQVATADVRLGFFRIDAGGEGSKILGLSIVGGVYLNATADIVFERNIFGGYVHFEAGTVNNVTFRKNFFYGNAVGNSSSVTITNFVCENNIFYNNGHISLDRLSGTGNIFRNNSALNGGNGFVLVNTYIANNIFGTYGASVLTNSTVKNNFFQMNQPLSGTATNNVVSQDMTAVFVAGTTGSFDSRLALKAGSPAIGAGLTVGSVVSPNCGAYGGPDPYKLSGIPNIPTIYTLTVPTSIPSGTATMNVTFSTRNNN
ncbi:hypothetical protein LZZ85_10215 [Terrimonas sp. NA20]|uniref:Right handed beta helix domain-containing protein n=1 Tax=Terrimonas ginsenosidimutans TaxID=2908004 RepID=A0ABS9KQQ5_9BACT|nr:hypothetical protein [Terrimonas ginsenosidimutans]MCG2614658.1 hypothetical protein [Terrimonas ginsenosidimutans]